MDPTEAERLEDLMRYGVLDTPPEEGFDRLTALAAELFEAPIALVSLLDAKRQWFKSRQGVDLTSTDRELAFCAHTIQGGPGSIMVVENATQDARFQNNPLVTGAPGIRFYAGAVIASPAGHALGTLCVIDTQPRPAPTENKLRQLGVLARMVETEMELRRAIRETHEKHRTLTLAESMAGVGQWRLDVKTHHVVWSDVVYKIHGVDRETFNPNLADNVSFYHPDDQATVTQHVSAAIAEKSGFRFQLRLRRADGQLRHVVCEGTSDLAPSGEVTALFGVFQDITDQVAALEEIRQSEAQYRLLAENSGDLIMRTDEFGRLSYISPAVTAAIGYRPEEMLGRPWSQFVDPEDAPRVDAAKRAQLESWGALPPQAIEYRLRRRDGRQLWLEGWPTFALDPGGSGRIGVTDVVRDITAHKQGEEELRKARAKAEAAAETKSRFLANMSHELRTPLTAVLGFSALMNDQPDLSPTVRNYLRRISNAGEVLLATVNDILDFSKLESGQVRIQRQPSDPRALAEQMLELFSLQAEQKALSLGVEGLDTLPTSLSIDPERIKQVLLNLIGNAIKFTSTGNVRLEIDYADGRLTLAVVDTGPGIAPEDVERLFRRFSQVDASITRLHGGTGLGLAICKGLMEAMGGQIGVQSEIGRGSRFWVWLPAPIAGTVQSEPKTEAPVIAKVDGGLIPAGCRVLLAEDNPVNRALVSAILGPLEVEITEARDGLEAVDAAQTIPFDLILMDMRMPRLDGLGATRRIRAEAGPNAGAPIIAFSADAGVQLGVGLFDALVAKPLSPANLIQVMADLMASKDKGNHAAARRA